jgi:glycosyltransferase involved in cell wall biosynthesis
MPTIDGKIRLLAFGDSPVVPSGFGTVMKNIFYHLGKTGRFQIDIFGINDRGAWKDPDLHPYRVYQALPPGETDPYGRSRFVDIVRGGGIDLEPYWDLIFFLNDPFVLEKPIPYFKLGTIPAVKSIQKTHYTHLPPETWFKTIGYFPVDSPVKPHWVKQAISQVDYPVAYTEYGHQEIEKASWLLDDPFDSKKLAIIPHGNNFDEFYPLPKSTTDQFKKDFFQGAVREETFVVIVVGRNQRRKDLPRAMKIFKEFQKRRPDSFLYIHAQDQEEWGSLQEIALQLNLKQGTDWNHPQDFVAAKGFPANIVNALYNSADVHLSATQGEGWGLPLSEAMATKTINLAPHHTSIPELFNTTGKSTSGVKEVRTPKVKDLATLSLRGIPYAAGSTTSEWTCHGSADLERIRPLGNVDDAVQKLLWIYDHPKEVKQITTRAHKWIQTLPWSKVAAQWDTLFQKAYQALEKERTHPQKTAQKWQAIPIPSRPHPANKTK